VKRCLSTLIGLAVVLSMLLAAGDLPALAQGERPPGSHPARYTGGGQRTQPPEEEPNARNRSAPTPAAASGAPLPAVMGEPGLSFRYVETYGVTEEAYPASTSYFNGPNGLFIDGSDNLYLAEELGSRMIKFDSSGSVAMTIGTAGSVYIDNYVLNGPKAVSVDSDGNVWVADYHRLTEYDSSGTYIQVFPKWDNNPWDTGTDNQHFNTPRGIAFDSDGNLYVSDTDNQRIQVYDLSGGSPVYSLTIGVTGTPKSDNTGFDQPAEIAFDSTGRLYVLDTANYRVQRCTYSSGWGCATFFGVTGVPGDDLSHLGWAFGLTVDPSDNVFIADSGNARVLKCDPSGTCALFAGVSGSPGSDNAHLLWPASVAVDSGANVLVSDYDGFRIQKYDSDGTYLTTLGTTGVPYPVDTSRLNHPWGIGRASDGSLYVTEERGNRLVKLNASGVQEWAFGDAGVKGDDDSHLGSYWSGPQGNVAVDASGNIFVPDTGNDRVQIISFAGSLVGSIGSWGTGDYQFACPAGVAISPVNGDLYVVDHCNERIEIFTSSRVFKARLGVTGVSGSDDNHFDDPWGVAIDGNGNIYVADSENHRVQKCTLSGSSGTCSTFAGQTGVAGDSFSLLAHPLSVAADSTGRVYVADEWNNRVQVFDDTGAYLTTIGGKWGFITGDMRSPSGIVVDSADNVYVTDRDNHRVQKFSLGYPGWMQRNINGFGERQNVGVSTLATFAGQLYAGLWNQGSGGAQLWRMDGSGTWSPMTTNGFGHTYNVAVDHLLEFNGNLYAGTWADATNGGELYRSGDGSVWTRVVSAGFGDPTNAEVFRLAVFNNQLYASTWSYDGGHGAEIWRSSSGDAGGWSRVVPNGFGSADNVGFTFAALDGQLYAGSSNASGGEIWRSSTGDAGSWTKVGAGGFGDADNSVLLALAAFNGRLYAATHHVAGGGSQVWRCQVCDGSDWTRVVNNGFGDSETRRMPGLSVLSGHLYLVIGNSTTGLGVWRTRTGDAADWTEAADAGFGDSSNLETYWNNALAVFNGRLLVGTFNYGNGGEIWEQLVTPGYQVWLPLITR